MPITLPLKIRSSTESFAIDDAAGRAVSSSISKTSFPAALKPADFRRTRRARSPK